jgi:putative chitinase
MTADELLAIMPQAKERALTYTPLLNASMAEFHIEAPRQQAAFLAQIGHESGALRWTRELGSGSIYESRADLGNTVVGDGRRFKGRGLIQITGRANYRECGTVLGLNLLQFPELLEKPATASRSAAWFWHSRRLNRFADVDQFGALTKAINGGYTGLDDRLAYWLRARHVFHIAPYYG